MIILSFFLVSFISSLLISFLSPLNVYLQEWYFIFIIIGMFFVSLIVYLLIFIIFLVFYTGFVNRKKEYKTKEFDRRFMKRICEMVLQLFRVKLNVRGLEKIPTDKKFLLVQNHLSNFDPVSTIWGFRYFNFSFILKKSLMDVPFFGNFLFLAGQLPLDRENNREGLKTIIKAINVVKDDKASIAVYPEGTRSKDSSLASFHPGTFKIALKAGCPIVVTTVVNTESIKYRAPFKSTNVYLDVVSVLEYDDFKDMQTEDIALYVHGLINDNLKELDTLRDNEELKHKKNR